MVSHRRRPDGSRVRIALWLLATVATLVLLFRYHTSTMGVDSTTLSEPDEAPPGIVTGPPDVAAGPSPTTTGAPAPGGTSRGATRLVVNGTTVETRYGPLQVQIRVAGGRIVDVTALRLPDAGRRDREISDRAAPILRREALAAQGADIDSVSGATYTSEGYRTSLQAAIDAAHLR